LFGSEEDLDRLLFEGLVHSETYGRVMNRRSRRDFMFAVSHGAVMTGGAALLGLSLPPMLRPTAIDAVVPTAFSVGAATPESFRPFVGSAFQILEPHGVVVDAVLTQVTALPRHNRAATVRDPFSLMFSAPHAGPAFHSLVTLQHHELGRLELSVRTTDTNGGRAYEAVFG
jgi:hypothetical protein